jgi:hypothetical protein
MSKLQIHAGLALVMFAGRTDVPQVLLKSPYARPPRRPTRGGAINGRIKNRSSSPPSLPLCDAARIAAAPTR